MNLITSGEVRVKNVQLCLRIGEAEAEFVGQLHYWLQTSKHEVDGRKWIYNTVDQWQMQFPYWSKRKMEMVLKSCRDEGLILVGEFNRVRSDRTIWYTIDYDHPAFQGGHTAKSADSHTAKIADSDTAKFACSNHKTTHKITQEITEFSTASKTVDAIAAEQGLGTPEDKETFEFDEETCYNDLDPTNGTDVSMWWRTCLRGYGHSKKMQPEMTFIDQKQLKTLLKQLGPGGSLRVMMALKHWVEYKKHADSEFGVKSTVKPVIQKFILGRNAIAAFEPPKEVDWSAKEWKTL